MSNETTLLPCPFCGGKATVTEFNHGCIISCENDAKAWINGKDNVDGHLAHIQSRSKAEAIAAWNTRAAKPCYATDYTHDHCKYSVNRGCVEDTRFFIPTAELGGGTLTAEQAIAATLGSELNPDGLPNGLTISDDSTLLNWCGENYVKQSTLGSGTLTAEQVEKIVNRNCEWYEGGELDAQAIADELNAELGSGACELTETDNYNNANEIMQVSECSACGETRCPHSGRKTVKD